MFAAKVIVFGFLLIGVNSQQSAVSYGINSDGSTSMSGKVPIAGSDKNLLSAFASHSNPSGAISKGLSLDNVNGHGLSVSHGTIPGFGQQLTGAGRLNLIQNPNHRLDANAFLTRNMPKFEGVPNFNTVGGNLDYTFKDRIGASVGAAHTPFLQRTDYSALGKLNVFKSPSTSVDFNAGLQKSISPQFSRTQPVGGFSFTRFF